MRRRATDRTGREEFCTLSADLVVATAKSIKNSIGPALIGRSDGGAVLVTVKGDKAILRTSGAECLAPGGKIVVDGKYEREVVDF